MTNKHATTNTAPMNIVPAPPTQATLAGECQEPTVAHTMVRLMGQDGNVSRALLGPNGFFTPGYTGL